MSSNNLFDNNIDNAIKCAPALLRRNTIFNYKNIRVALYDDKVAGFIVILDEYPLNHYKNLKKAFKESLKYLPDKFDQIMDEYFNKIDYEWNNKYIVAISVLPEYRQKYIASLMVKSLDKHYTYSLILPKNNELGHKLCFDAGFSIKYEFPSYDNLPYVEMIKKK